MDEKTRLEIVARAQILVDGKEKIGDIAKFIETTLKEVGFDITKYEDGVISKTKRPANFHVQGSWLTGGTPEGSIFFLKRNESECNSVWNSFAVFIGQEKYILFCEGLEKPITMDQRSLFKHYSVAT